jgi:hypothetical protein
MHMTTYFSFETMLALTAAAMFGVSVIAVVVAPMLGVLRVKMIGRVIVFSIVGFIPSCTLGSVAIDYLAMGRSHHATADGIWDRRVRFYLPAAARDITLDKTGTSFKACFVIDPLALEAHLDAAYAAIGEPRQRDPEDEWDALYAGDPDADERRRERLQRELSEVLPLAPDEFDSRTLGRFKRFCSPREGDGGGCRFWIDPVTGRCFARAGYW